MFAHSTLSRRLALAAVLSTTLSPAMGLAQVPDADAPAAVAPAAAPAPVLDRRDLEVFGDDEENLRVPAGVGTHAVIATGRVVTIDSTTPDVFAAGETVLFQGEALDNFFGAGKLVRVNGPVGGDVFALGETLEIESDVRGDLYVFGGSVFVPDGVTIYGDVYSASGELTINGDVRGDVRVAASNARLDGDVGGDVIATVDKLDLGQNTKIGGDLSYVSSDEANLTSEGHVAGETNWSNDETSQDEDEDTWGSAFGVIWRGFGFASALLVATVLMLLFPRLFYGARETLRDESAPSLGAGLAVLFGLPVLAVVLMAFVLPIPLSLLILSTVVLASFIARQVVAYTLGAWLFEGLGQEVSPWIALLTGMVLTHLLFAVPWLGSLAMLAATLMGLGAMFLNGRRAAKPAQG